MQVILREDVPNLGEVGDIISVKPGYARNYLLPRKLAVHASDRQMRRVEHEKRVIESQVAKLRKGAEGQKSELDSIVLKIEKAAGSNEKLFGSVTSMEIEALLRDLGHRIDRRRILLDDNIKALGDYNIDIKLHRDVTATIKVQVVAREESE